MLSVRPRMGQYDAVLLVDLDAELLPLAPTSRGGRRKLARLRDFAKARACARSAPDHSAPLNTGCSAAA